MMVYLIFIGIWDEAIRKSQMPGKKEGVYITDS